MIKPDDIRVSETHNEEQFMTEFTATLKLWATGKLSDQEPVSEEIKQNLKDGVRRQIWESIYGDLRNKMNRLRQSIIAAEHNLSRADREDLRSLIGELLEMSAFKL